MTISCPAGVTFLSTWCYMLQFLGVKDIVSYPKLQGLLLRIHRVTCEDRIADFNTVKQLIRGTMFDRACEILCRRQQTVDKHVVPGDASPTCNKFIVLTTQRSGSTEALGHQPEVLCPFHSEMLIN